MNITSKVTEKYLVQVGRGDKGSYTTRYSFENDTAGWKQAVFYFTGINIGNGYKKRLVGPDGKVIAREFSS